MVNKTAKDFVERMAGFGGITAIKDINTEISYAELAKEINKRAKAYSSRGLSGKRVLIKDKFDINWVTDYLALLCAGAVVVLRESGAQPDEEDIVDSSCSVEDIIEELQNTEHEDIELEDLNEGDIANIIYTSGTTGKQKRVMLTHKNVFSNAVHSYLLVGDGILKPGDRTIPVLPTTHMFGVTASILAPLYVGMTLCMIGELKDLNKMLAHYSPKILFLVPMIAKALLARVQRTAKAKGIEPAVISKLLFGTELELIVSGGAPLSIETIRGYEELGIKLLNGYGITECSPVVTASSAVHNKPGSVGKVGLTPYCDVMIKDGRIHVKGDIVMKGYHGLDELVPGEWIDTQDIGYIDSDGFLFITGRDNNLIIMDDGNNISPEELEEILENTELIQDALVYQDEEKSSQSLAAQVFIYEEYFNATERNELEKKLLELIDSVNKDLPNYKRIRRASIRDGEFPKTRLGKIRRGEAFNGKGN